MEQNVKKTIKKKRRYHYLTMLRALSLIAVSTYHLFGHAFSGGFLAVIAFLLMSGFLMEKSNLYKDFTIKDLGIAIKNRLMKILPPLGWIMGLSLLVSLFFARNIFDDSARSSLSVFFAFENIRQILKGASYFDRNGNFNIFVHLWYIAIYVQFILIFYLLKYICQKIKSKNIKIWLLFTISMVSMVISFYLSYINAPIIRIYYGTDTRLYAFLFGMIFYLIYSEYLVDIKLEKNTYRIIIAILLSIFIGPMFFIDGQDIWIYREFFLFYTIIVGLLVMFVYKYENDYEVSARNIGFLGTILEYLGLRSLYLYIWQYIVQIFFAYFLVNIIEIKFIYYLLQVVLIIILSEISHLIFDRKKSGKVFVIIPILVLIGLNIVSFAIGNQKEKEMKELKARFDQSQEEIKKNNEALKKKKEEEKEEEKDKKKESSEKDPIDKEEEDKKEETDRDFEEKPYDDFDFTEKELAYCKDLSITAIGDSVLINIDKYLREFVPNLYLDGEVGRDMIQGPEVLANIKANVGLGNIILVSLGSNGSANHSDMQKIMDLADGRDVYFVNTSHLQSYMDKVNSDMEDFVKNNKKAHLIDWRSYVKDRPDLLAVDRTHPNIPGSEGYARLVLRKILNVNKVPR